MEHFSPQIKVKTKQKKKKEVFTKNGTLFFLEFKWTPTLRCAPESNYWGDADVDHTQTMGGTVKLLRGYISPPGFGTPVHASLFVAGESFASSRSDRDVIVTLQFIYSFFILY